MKIRHAAPALLLALAACASSQHIRTTIHEEITTDFSAVATGPTGEEAVRIRCTETDTIFEKGGVTIRFVGHAGYRGELGERHGELQIGEVSFLYDGESFSYSGPLARGEYEDVPDGWSCEIDQTGASRAISDSER